jgi:hypothetical protein
MSFDSCDSISDAAELAALEAGATAFVAAQINDWVDDFCSDGGFGDLFDLADEVETFDDGVGFFDVTCNSAGSFEISVFDSLESDNARSITVTCMAPGTLTTLPAAVEIWPAPGNVSSSLIWVPAAPGVLVQFNTDRCAIETSAVDSAAEFAAAFALYNALNVNVHATATAINTFAATAAVDGSPLSDTTTAFQTTAGAPTSAVTSIAAAILRCDVVAAPGATPGTANVQVIIGATTSSSSTLATVLNAQVRVIGPVANLSVTAAPTSLICGEKAEITATATDAAGQAVSDLTLAEFITNHGGVLGGTTSTINISTPVNPLSSTVAQTFGGVAKAFLLTSIEHVGAYEVVVSIGGLPSVAPRVAQVTVTCSLPAAPAPPTTTAPSTGTGSIRPPNTGDAGLVAEDSSWALFAVAGMVAFAVAGLATLKFARR